MPGDSTPDRMTLTNVQTGDAMTAQFNPDEVKEKLVVNYKDLEILGLSHRPKQYQNTSNLALSYELGFDGLSTRGIEISGVSFSKTFQSQVTAINQARAFLMSLCYAPKGAQTVVGGGPPQVLFTWPNLYSLVCVITGLDFTHKRFARKLPSVLFTVCVTIEEIRTVRLFSEDLLANATIRSS